MSNVTLKIGTAADPLGTPIETWTDEDILDLKLEISLSDLGKNTVTIPRSLWEASVLKPYGDGAYYVRVEIPYIDASNPFWGFWLISGEFVLVSPEESGGETITIGGPGPAWYLTNARLNWQQYTPQSGVTVQDRATWHFIGKNYGQILSILLSEDGSSPRQALTALDTPGWNNSTDSDGNAWGDFGGIYSIPVGTDYLSAIRDLQKAGELFAYVNPKLDLQAYKTYGNDLTGGAFGSGVVRFERGVNIIGELRRQNEKGQAYTHVLTMGNEKTDEDGEVIEGALLHLWVQAPDWSDGDAIRQGFMTYDTNSLVILERAGQRLITRSRDRAERMLTCEVMPGQDEANGLYLPGHSATDRGNFWLGDRVTFDTGAGNDLDLNETDLVIAKIRMQLGEASRDDSSQGKERSWRVFIETGDDVEPSGSADTALNTGSKAGPSCPCLRLCASTIAPTEATQEAFFNANDPGGTSLNWTGLLANQGGLPGQGANGTSYYYFKSGSPSEWSNGYAAAPGTDYYVTGFVKDIGSGEGFKFGFFTSAVGVGGNDANQTGSDLHLYSFAVEGATGGTWTPFSAGPFTAPVDAVSWALGHDGLISFDEVEVTSGGADEGAHPLHGTSQMAAHCDHIHHVFIDRDPTEDDDEADEYPAGTLWLNTDTDELFILVDPSAGAAVWVAFAGSGVTDHGALTGLSDDDHPQYLRTTGGGKDVINTVAASGSTETLDLADGNVHDVTLTANCTITLTGATNGVNCTMAVLLRQDGTGGRTVTWPGSVNWVGGAAPTLETAAGAWNWVYLTTLDGGTTWFGEAAQAGGGGSGAPTTADYLVGTAQAGLSAEIVVGTSPGGELGGTWASPTVDATHSGSSHADATAAAHPLNTGDPHTQYATNTEFDDHSARHESGGADAIKLDDLAAPDDNTDLNASTAKHGLLKKLPNDATKYLDGAGNFTDPGLAGGSTGNVIATPSGSVVTIPGLALGDRKPASPGTYDEEFDGTADTLPANWAFDTTPSGSDTWKLNSRWPSVLAVEGTAVATYNLSRTSFAAAATFGIWAKLFMGPWRAADDPQLRLYCTDSTDGERRGGELRATGANAATFRGLKRTGAGAENVWGTAIAAGFPTGTWYIGITRTSNNWILWISTDGLTWFKIGSSEAQTFTVDRFRLLFKTSADGCFLGCDWIRYRTDTAFPRI